MSGCQVQQDMILDTCVRLHLGEPLIIWDDGVSTSAVPFNERPGIIRLLRSLRPTTIWWSGGWTASSAAS